MIEIFTDGSCKNNPGPGKHGFIVTENKIEIMRFRSPIDIFTTNNKQELLGIIAALKYIKKNKLKNCIIYSDSNYCVKGINVWSKNWIKTNYKKGKLLNLNLWKELLELKNETIFKHIPAHTTKTDFYSNFNRLIDEFIQF